MKRDSCSFVMQVDRLMSRSRILTLREVLMKRHNVLNRVHHGYTPGYRRQTHTCTRNGSVPAPRVWVWSRVPSLVPVPVPAAGIPVEYEQGGRAKVRATQATAQRARWCALYRRFCSSQGGDGMAGASSSSGCVASRRLRCEDEMGASSSSSSGQQGRVVVVASSGASPVVA